MGCQNQKSGRRSKHWPGSCDPALNQLIGAALETVDLSKGVVLDGYPATKAQADFLTALREKLNLTSAIIVHLKISDEVVRKRLKQQDSPDFDQQLKDYHRELDFVRNYFPQADIREVDANKKRSNVDKQIRKLIQN